MLEKAGWVFVSNDEAYAAVKVVTGGYQWAEEPARGFGMSASAHRLMLKEKYSPIIIQTGRGVDYGSFKMIADQRAEIEVKSNKIAEDTLKTKGDTLKTKGITRCGYVLPKIDGKTLDLDLKYNYKSPYMECKTGSDIVTVRYGKRRWDYDFGKNTITEAAE